MLKMVGEARGGRKLVILGLSHMNLQRLKQGKPIHFPGEDVALAGVEVMIFSGKTEQSMARDLADLVGPGTQTKIDPRTTDA
jgi:hypothetical protein